METIYRTGEIRNLDKESRKVQFVISDESKDRHRTVLNMDGWNLDNFNRNGIVGYQHDVYGGGMCKGPDPDSVIGRGRAWIEPNGTRANGQTGPVLMGEVEFEPEDVNPLAEKIFKKVQHGTLSATSVGFSPIGGGRMVNDKTGDEKELKEVPYQVPAGHTFYYEGQELLEYSIVNIPSNPNALKKNLRDQTANALHFVKRQLGEGWKYGDIEQLRVLDLIELLEHPEKHEGKKIKDIVLDSQTKFQVSADQLTKAIKKGLKETEEEIEESARGEGRLQTYRRRLTLTKNKEIYYGSGIKA